MAEKRTEIAPRQERAVGTRSLAGSPFAMFDRIADEIDRVFDDFGFGRGWMRPRFGRELMPGRMSRAGGAVEMWTPPLEVFQRDNELVVRAELPGMKKEDINVNVTDEGIAISGERKQEQEEERGGMYRSERSYGSFFRLVPLPPGVMADQAKASFKDGVLEITMPAAPDQVTRGRRLEIAEGTEGKK
jgi:HSP20 family protein